MAFTADDIRFHYSGGSANTLGSGSLGGIISNTRVTSQVVSTPSAVTGVTITAAFNNAQGVGVLTWSSATTTLSWRPPSSVTTYGVVVSAPGSYTVGGSDGSITVTTATLPSVFRTDSLNVSFASGNVFDSVAAVDSLVGSVEYRCLYVKNTSTEASAVDTRVWIKSLTSGPDEVSIGLDPAGVGNGTSTGVATVVADELSAPAGVVFSTPLGYATALAVGTLAVGQSAAFWERRIVPANTTGDITSNTSTIAVAVTV
jgi:hypothetical protein